MWISPAGKAHYWCFSGIKPQISFNTIILEQGELTIPAKGGLKKLRVRLRMIHRFFWSNLDIRSKWMRPSPSRYFVSTDKRSLLSYLRPKNTSENIPVAITTMTGDVLNSTIPWTQNKRQPAVSVWTTPDNKSQYHVYG
jgi:hypothetical protein